MNLTTQNIPIDLIDPNPLNQRKAIPDEWIADTEKTLRSVGQLEAIKVRPRAKRFELVDGEIRWRAAKRAGLTELRAEVGEYSDEQVLDIVLTTGTTKHPLSAIEAAAGYRARMAIDGISQRELAARIGVNDGVVQRRLELLNLPEAAQAAVIDGRVAERTAWLVARIPDPEARAAAADVVFAGVNGVPMTFDEAKVYIEHSVCRSLAGARFDAKDAKLVPAAGACTACPWNSSVNRETYADTKKQTCMRPACFEQKTAAARARLVLAETKAGRHVLPADINARIYPANEVGLAVNSEYAEVARPVTKDLLKREVAEHGAVPTWADLLPAEGTMMEVKSKVRDEDGEIVEKTDRVPVPGAVRWTAFDQEGRAVQVVKISEALLAADMGECTIFNDATMRRYGLEEGAIAKKSARERKSLSAHVPAAAAEKEESWEDIALRELEWALETWPDMAPEHAMAMRTALRLGSQSRSAARHPNSRHLP